MGDCDQNLKLITLGESGAGKTKLLIQYKDESFNESGLSTVGIECYYKKIRFKNKKVKLLMYDTSGQEKFRTIVANYYKNTDGVVLVFDVTRKSTFTKIEYWVHEINENAGNDNGTFILFGNKCDLDSEREVTYEEGKALADKYGISYLEGSAKTGKNVKELFIILVRQIMEKKNTLDEPSEDRSNLSYKKSFGPKKEIYKDLSNKEKCC